MGILVYETLTYVSLIQIRKSLEVVKYQNLILILFLDQTNRICILDIPFTKFN